MLKILANPDYARLFSAQIVALLGTGLLTVALGLMAYDLAGEAAGAVLGTALTIKMVAYVVLSPLAAAWFAGYDRKKVLIWANVARAAIALLLPFVEAVWQIYILIFLLQAASATFTPAFQATLPDILPREEDYTRALSLSRLAYDLENIVSPTLAGGLLLVMSYHWLFVGTVFGFVGSALLILPTLLPQGSVAKERPFRERLTRGARIYLATPRLRGLLSLNFAAASASALVLVNTVVIVRAYHAGSESDVAIAFGAYGLGSMLSALLLPSLLERVSDRLVMFSGATALTLVMAALGTVIVVQGWVSWGALLATWFASGLFYSAILTPSGRLLKRSAHAEDRPAVFAAQFALSHACWLVTYPLAGYIGLLVGMGETLLIFAAASVIAISVGLWVWPTSTGSELQHSHDDLPPGHPHLKGQSPQTSRHRHAIVIDDEHRVWPDR